MKKLLISFVVLSACAQKFDRETLMDPETCKTCHPEQYQEWSGSMHAYAAEDPVFLAMNTRGQRETGGELGDFCVNCHAPMAVREGATTDGLNLDQVPKHLKGVTCYFCHNINQIDGDHNAMVSLANDSTMFGSIADPVDNNAHSSKYSGLHDRHDLQSARLCGACHDIVTPKGVHLERTFKEWKDSLYAHDTPQERQTCGNCHMQGRDGLAAMAEGVALRRIHDHSMVGVDVALTDFPEQGLQQQKIQKVLDTTLVLQLCVARVAGGIEVTVDLENLAAGHAFPSGATQDRRAWIEVIAYLGPNKIFSSGEVADGQPVTSLSDPNLWLLGDRLFDERDQEVHMFWEAAKFESALLPAPTAIAPWDPEYTDPHVQRTYTFNGIAQRITARVRMRPMGLDVLDSLIESGDLQPEVRDRIPTFTLGATEIEWRAQEHADIRCLPEL